MRSLILIAAAAVASASAASAKPLSPPERAAVEALPRQLTEGWLRNDREKVMGLFAPQAVFIPHDGVAPKIGWQALDRFWFPSTGAAGTVTAFKMTVENVAGESGHAVIWGRSDLHWQDKTTAYHWPGYYLIAAERRGKTWLITHLMSSDEQPATQPVIAP